MCWRSGKRSSNIEDRRGRRMRPMRRGAKLGGGATIIILLVSLFLGADPQVLLNAVSGAGGSGVSTSSSGSMADGANIDPNDETAHFVSVILADTEQTWQKIFAQSGSRYQEPKLVLFTDQVRSACGTTSSASGPFYCSGDNQVYIDLSFFRQLKQMGAPGDFAQAYVIGHEVGHHIQNITGTSQKIRSMQARTDKAGANALSVKQELQADCYAGVWAYHSNKDRNMLEEGDVEEGLRAAAAIGDDALMRGAGRSIRPESFTHGSSRQRIKWLRIGLETGSPDACDTFANS